MSRRLPFVLFVLAGCLVALDLIWGAAGKFDVETGAYGILVLLLSPLLVGSTYYGLLRKERSIATALGCLVFLVVFSAACNLLSYFLLTIAGPRIDNLLMDADRVLGISWPAIMTFAAYHPIATRALLLIYLSVMPQSVLLIFLLGWRQQPYPIYAFCIAIAAGAIMCLAFWTTFPSFGAFSVYNLPPDVASRLGLALNGDYGHTLVEMLKNGPGPISPHDLRGLVGFPSFHTVQALILAWYSRSLRYWRWPALMLNLLVLVSAPIHGGHDVVDLVGGAVVAVLAIVIADRAVRWSRAGDHARSIVDAEPVPSATMHAA